MKEINGLRILNGFALLFAVFHGIALLFGFPFLNGWFYLLFVSLGYLISRLLKKPFWIADYGSFKERFQWGIGLLVGECVVGAYQGRADAVEQEVLGYLLLYLITSVILLRSLRHMEYYEDHQTISRINLGYLVILLGFSAILSTKVIRSAVFHGIRMIYEIIMDAISYVLSWIIYGISLILGAFFGWLEQFFQGIGLRHVLMPEMKGSVLGQAELSREELTSSLLASPFFIWLGRGVVTLVLLYLIYRILRRGSIPSPQEQGYTESREYIPKTDKERLRNPSSRYGKDSPAYEIRHYYRKFLKLCVSRKLELKDSDTTLQIQTAAETEFDNKNLYNMREIYLEVRYGEKSTDEDTADRFRNFYHKLKKG